MHGRSWIRTLFRSQRVNESEALQKSAREHFYPNFYPNFFITLT